MPTLVSPGVAVSVIDESSYATAGNGTVPLIILATAQDKTVPGGTGLATKTAKSAAAQPVLLTSQRELAQLFGTPIFKTLNGTPQHGDELNEYGLLATYSYLGIANRAYVLHADIDLGQLEPSAIEPKGAPANGTYWLDTADTVWGIFESDGSSWVAQSVEVYDSTMINQSNIPQSNLGMNGDYAVVTATTANKIYKKINGAWSEVTSAALTSAYAHQTTVTAAPHYQVPDATVHAGDVWFKLTTPNSGFKPVVKRYSSTTAQFNELSVKAYIDDASATTGFGAGLVVGSLYANYDANSARFELRRYDGSMWSTLVYEASNTAPKGPTPDGTLWYNPDLVADIYVKQNMKWRPVSGHVTIDTAEPDMPTAGDIWVDTNDMENYPQIKRYDGDMWVLRDNADQTTPQGVIFADLTPMSGDQSNGGGATPYDVVDTPDPEIHPDGMLLWNSMVSTYNVKKYNAATGQWHTISGNISAGPKAGAPYMGRKAQRQCVVVAMQGAVTACQKLREETINFSLIAAPGYPELIDEMLTLNVDRKETAFVIADSPLRLPSTDAQGLIDWVTGVNAGTNGEDGIVTKSSEAAVYYPSVLTTDLSGYDVVAPASHAVLRTYAYNDNVSYPWFAPAGLTRGVVTNCANFGYVNMEGEFMPVALTQGQRDTLYANKMNPLVNFPGQGLVVWGQKTLSPIASALDRVNVARLVAYLRTQFDPLARPFVFEPNDQKTRSNVKTLFDNFLADIRQKRGVYDFVVVCDDTNNTPSRIDANELWIDIAIEPTKAAEFIYIPIRLVNTGTLH